MKIYKISNSKKSHEGGRFFTRSMTYNGEKEKTLKTVCSWCGKVMQEGDGDLTPDGELNITHGICDECEQKILKEI